MTTKRHRLISIIDLLFTNKIICDDDIKKSKIYEEFIYQKSRANQNYEHSDAFRMLLSRDIEELIDLKIIKENSNGSYVLTEAFENIRKDYYINVNGLYSSDLSNDEVAVQYIDTSSLAESIFDIFSLSRERRKVILKSMELKSFLDSFTQVFETKGVLKIPQADIQKVAIEIMIDNYILPEKHKIAWTDQEKKDVISLISQGRCIDDIAKQFKRTRRAIIRQLPEYKILKNIFLQNTLNIKNDPEAIWRLCKLDLLSENGHKISKRLKDILLWSKSKDIPSSDIVETILYDSYFTNCHGKTFIPLSRVHLDMYNANLMIHGPENEDDYFYKILTNEKFSEELDEEEYERIKADEIYMERLREKKIELENTEDKLFDKSF